MGRSLASIRRTRRHYLGTSIGAAAALAGCGAEQGSGENATGGSSVQRPAGSTPTTPGVSGQIGTGDPRTTGDQAGYAQATSVAMGGTGGSTSQNRGLTTGSAGSTPGVSTTPNSGTTGTGR